MTHGDVFTPRTFEHLNQVTWYKVRLDKGQDYALWGYDGGDGYPYATPAVTVYGPTGKRLQSFPIGSTDVVSGREFRAPVAGTYYLEAVAAGKPGGSFPYTYYVGVAFDCRGGPTTRCTLAVGQKATGFYNFYLDDDARRITAKAGRRYTLQLAGSGSLAATAEVRDRGGKLVGQCAAEGRPRPVRELHGGLLAGRTTRSPPTPTRRADPTSSA